MVGASLDDVEEEEEEAEEQQEEIQTGPKAGCYQIVGTLKDPDAKKPDFVKEIFQVVMIRIYLVSFFRFNSSFNYCYTCNHSTKQESSCLSSLLNAMSLCMRCHCV